MVLFEIHQRFKGHFLSELRISFNLNVRNIMDNKQFCKSLKPFFFNKVGGNERITLIEEDKVISEDKEVADI